jgi:hypothetical protein
MVKCIVINDWDVSLWKVRHAYICSHCVGRLIRGPERDWAIEMVDRQLKPADDREPCSLFGGPARKVVV